MCSMCCNFDSEGTLKSPKRDKQPLYRIFESIFAAIYVPMDALVPTLDMVPLNACPYAHMVNPTLTDWAVRLNACLTDQI